MMKLLSLCLLFANTALLEAQPEFLSRVETLLPRSKCKVDVMEVAYPKRFQELTLKMQTVLATNKDWWLNYIKENAKTGEPLP
jgi:hypothetical protein